MLDAYIQRLIDENAVPGGVVVATQRRRVVYERCWGSCMRADGTMSPVTTALRHPMYSFSKGVATTVVAYVHAAGGFDWDDPVAKHIPGYDCKGKEGTLVRHLLSHSAGIPAPDLPVLENGTDWDDALRAAVEAEAVFVPGTMSAYHALSGLFVAACIACRVAGKDFVTLSREVLDAMGASTMTLEYPDDLSDVVIAPLPEDGEPLAVLKQLQYHPAGAYFGRPADMLQVIELHLDRGRDVVPWSSLGAMHVPQFAAQLDAGSTAYQGWGLGWMLGYRSSEIAGTGWMGFGPDTHANTFSHAGISTTLGVGDPDRDVAIAICLADGPYDSLGESGARATEIRTTVTSTILRECS